MENIFGLLRPWHATVPTEKPIICLCMGATVGRKALEKQRTEHDRRTPRFLLGGCYLYAPYREDGCYMPSWQMFSVPPQLWNVEH